MIITFLISLNLQLAHAKTTPKPIAPCTPEKIGRILGMDTKGIANISPSGSLKVLNPDPPCSPQLEAQNDDLIASVVPTVAVTPPLKLAGLMNGKQTHASAGAISTVECGSGLLLMATNIKSDIPKFTDDLFISEIKGQTLRKVNSVAKNVNISENVWNQLEAKLREKITKGFECSYGFYKGIPGKRQFTQVQTIPLSGNPNLKLAILALESKKSKMQDDTINPPSTETVAAVSVIYGNKPQQPIIFCNSEEIPLTESNEIKSLSVWEYGKFAFLKMRTYTVYEFQSFDAKGKLISAIQTSNGQGECD